LVDVARLATCLSISLLGLRGVFGLVLLGFSVIVFSGWVEVCAMGLSRLVLLF